MPSCRLISVGKTKDFRFILKSGAVVRTSLSDVKGKELEELGIAKLVSSWLPVILEKDRTRKR